MRTLFLNPPSFEGFDGGASSRWPAAREIESYWYPVWLCYPAGMLADSKVVDAPPHGVSIEQTVAMAKDFDSEIGPGAKVYLNIGSNQGVKAGDYFRAVRSYEADLHDPVDSLSFKASTNEDTQKKQAVIDPNFLSKTGGPVIRVRDLPRRAVGEVVVIATTPTTSTGMVVFAMESVHLGDDVELDQP